MRHVTHLSTLVVIDIKKLRYQPFFMLYLHMENWIVLVHVLFNVGFVIR